MCTVLKKYILTVTFFLNSLHNFSEIKYVKYNYNTLSIDTLKKYSCHKYLIFLVYRTVYEMTWSKTSLSRTNKTTMYLYIACFSFIVHKTT